MTSSQLLQQATHTVMQNYARQPIVFARGQGAWLWDTDGRRYLDLFAGFGGGILGHCHPALVEAVTQQAQKLWHVGNVFYNEPQIALAQRLNEAAFPGQAFYCHSGAEANEAAVKLARLRGSQASPKRWKIISLHKSFHGRTLAMLAATGNPKVREGFEPEVPGFVRIEGGDINALTAAIDSETAGIIMEPIQGEGGINEYPAGYAQQVRQLCDQHGITLIFDEVWSGCGRTGKWFGHQHFVATGGTVIEPDVMTLGKAAGGGLPVGVMYAKPQLAALFVPGKHGSTLGGNAICMAAACAIFDVIRKDDLLAHATKLGQHAVQRLNAEPRLKGKLVQIRGKGLMLGLELAQPPQQLAEKALAAGIIINLTAQKVIRLAPPINIPADEWDSGLDKLVDVLAGL